MGGGLIQNTPPIPGLVTGNPQKDFNSQLTELLQYANANSAEAVARGGVNLATLKTATSPTQAAQWWGEFEGPLVPGSDVRAGVATSVYNAVGSYTPGSQYTQPANSGPGATGAGATSATAILDSFPLGILNPLNIPSEVGNAIGGAAGSAAAGIGSGIESAILGIFGNIMKSLGFTSGKDFLIRISLIIMGVIILIIGIKSLANGTGSFTSGGSGSSRNSDSSSSDDGDLFSSLSDDDDSHSDKTASSASGNSSSGGGNLAGRSRPSSAANRSRQTPTRQTPTRRSAVGTSSVKSGATKATKYGPEKAIGKKAVETAALA